MNNPSKLITHIDASDVSPEALAPELRLTLGRHFDSRAIIRGPLLFFCFAFLFAATKAGMFLPLLAGTLALVFLDQKSNYSGLDNLIKKYSPDVVAVITENEEGKWNILVPIDGAYQNSPDIPRDIESSDLALEKLKESGVFFHKARIQTHAAPTAIPDQDTSK